MTARTRLKALILLLMTMQFLAFGVALAGTEDKLPSKYREWLTRDVVYLITAEERNAFVQLTNDSDRDQFIERFWAIRNPEPGSPVNTYKEEIYRRIAYANQFFGHESGTPGWRTDMGRVYITLGPPQQRAPYLGTANVRPMEIWFYSGNHPALPPFFYVIFYQREAGGAFRLYSPYLDGPGKLISSASTEGDRISSLKVIDQSLGREVARTTLSLLPDEPVDLNGATSSLQSDIVLNTIRNLANNPLNKDLLNERRRVLEAVSHRVVISGDYLDVLTVPLRDQTGAWNLHYVLRFRKPEDFTLKESGNGRFFYEAEAGAKVSDAKGNLIFEQRRKLSGFVDAAKLEAVKTRVFGYEGLLPLAPGRYHVEFMLSNESRKTVFREQRDITIPAALSTGMAISDIVPFSDASSDSSELAPFTVAGIKFTPEIGRGISVVPGQDLKFFYQIWAPPANVAAHNGSKLTAEYAFGRMGLRDTRTVRDEVAKSQFDLNGSLVNGKKIATADLDQGNYRLSISVVDPDTREKAFASFQFRVSDQNPSQPSWEISDPQLIAEGQNGILDFDRALAYQTQGDRATAAKLFLSAYQHDPQNEVFRGRLIESYFAEQKFSEVVDTYARSGVSAKTDEQTVLRIAESLDKTGDLPRSIHLLESAVQLHPRSGALYLALARYYQRAGNTARAAEMERKGQALIASAQPSS